MLQVLVVVLLVLPSKLYAVCPDDWEQYQNNCYKKFDTPASWDEARRECKAQNGYLAEVTDEAENTFVTNTFPGDNWLGLTGCHQNDVCYENFDLVTWNNFAAGEPDNEPQLGTGLTNNQFAVLIQDNGEWKDQPKSEKHSYICEKSEDPCKNLQCDPNGGECDRENEVCKCKPGYSGKRCDIAPCDTDPCLNGGTCAEVDTGYTCTCINYYSGKNCEVEPPCEAKKPCKHGVCEDVSEVDYKCKCEPTWIGKNCDERPCDARPCVNAMECINEGDSYECVCFPGWTGPECDKKGPASGDPHYTTFDGKRYDFMGKCEYVYAKDCSSDHDFEVLQQNEACGNGKVSCTRSIRVLFQGSEVRLERAGVVYVNGTRINNFPWKQTGSTIKITKYKKGALLDVPDLLFSVQWDGNMGIVVVINQRYEGNMCGLMGNADGNRNNDFQLPNKTITTDIAKFANSWKKNPKCDNGIVPPDPCKQLSQTNYDDIKAKCGKMKQPPFQQCNEKITPDIGYIPNCEYDMCAMNQNPTTAWCQSLESYDGNCTSMGVDIDWEGTADFLDCGNPCAEMQCFNGGRCENIDTTNFECICPTGFSGPTCKNVECKGEYISRGSVCYKKMTKSSWEDAECPPGDEFMYVEDDDENNFIYKQFVKTSKDSFWLNAQVCAGGQLCAQNYEAVLYHNFFGQFPASGCVQMRYENNGKWITKNCDIASYYICKYRKINL